MWGGLQKADDGVFCEPTPEDFIYSGGLEDQKHLPWGRADHAEKYRNWPDWKRLGRRSQAFQQHEPLLRGTEGQIRSWHLPVSRVHCHHSGHTLKDHFANV